MTSADIIWTRGSENGAIDRQQDVLLLPAWLGGRRKITADRPTRLAAGVQFPDLRAFAREMPELGLHRARSKCYGSAWDRLAADRFETIGRDADSTTELGPRAARCRRRSAR